MGFPSFPPSGRVVSLMEVLTLIGLCVIIIGYCQVKLIRRTLVGKYEESLFVVRPN